MARGVKFGRPKGPGSAKLDKHKEEIIALLKTGSRQTFIFLRSVLSFNVNLGFNDIDHLSWI